MEHFGFQIFKLRMPNLCFEVSVSQKFRDDNLGSSGSGFFLRVVNKTLAGAEVE